MGRPLLLARDTVLSSFSLYLRNRYDGSGSLDLRGYLATWDGTKAGTLLYSSTTRTMNAVGTLQEFLFSPGSIVTPGEQYVAFLSVSGLGAQADSTFGMPFGGDSIQGTFVYQNNGTDFGSLFTGDWSSAFQSNDVFFKAGFSAAIGGVPEPATWMTMIAGFGMIGGAMRRRRKVTTRVQFA